MASVSIEAPILEKACRQWLCSSRLKALEKSMEERITDTLLSSRCCVIVSIVSTSRCTALAPGSPPNWLRLGQTSCLALSRTNVSNFFDRKAVQDMFLQSAGDSGTLHFGMIVTYSTNH